MSITKAMLHSTLLLASEQKEVETDLEEMGGYVLSLEKERGCCIISK